MAAAVASINVDILANLNNFRKGIDEAKGLLASLASSANAIKGLAFAGAGILAGMAGFNGITGFVKSTVMLAAEAEKAQNSFEVLLGDATKAAKLLGDIRQYAATSPFTLTDTTEQVRQALIAGIKPEQVLPTVKMLGDVAGDPERLQRLMLAYTQVKTLGRLTGMELFQFNNANVPLVEHLATVMKKPEASIKQMIADGKVGFVDVVKAMRLMTDEGGRFYGMTDKYGGTFLGKVEQMKDHAHSLGREIGQIFIEELNLKGGADDIGTFINRIRGGLEGFRPYVSLIGVIARGAAQFAYEMGRAAVIIAETRIGRLTDYFPALKEMTGNLRETFTNLQNFKLDEEKIQSFANFLSDALMDPLSLIEDFFDRVFDKGKTNFMTPMLEGLGETRKLVNDINYMTDNIRGAKSLFSDMFEGAAKRIVAWQDPELRPLIRSNEFGKALEASKPIAKAHPDFLTSGRNLKAPTREMLKVDVDYRINAGRVNVLRSLEEEGKISFERYLALSKEYHDQMIDMERSRLAAGYMIWDGFSGLNNREMANAKRNQAAMENAFRRDVIRREADRIRREQDFPRVAGGLMGGLSIANTVNMRDRKLGGSFGSLAIAADIATGKLNEIGKVKIPDPVATPNAQESINSASQLDKTGPKFDIMVELGADIRSLQRLAAMPKDYKDYVDPKTFNYAVSDIIERATKNVDMAFKAPTIAEWGSQAASQAQIQALGGHSAGNDPVAKLQRLIDMQQQKMTEDAKTAAKIIGLFGQLLGDDALPTK